MKTKILFPFSFAVILAMSIEPPAYNVLQTKIDTALPEHRLDGLINEWPAMGFSTEEDTRIRFMADHDSANLYLAISVPDQGLQIKMSRIGMKLFIDLKGKKKENMGIEFPIKKELNMFNSNQTGGMTPESMRRAMIIAMIQLKLFGFGEEEPKAQQLELPGSAHVAINWDTAGTLNIEYKVPLILLGNKSSLDQKTISLGWKINSTDQTTASSPPVIGTATTSTRGRPASPRNSKINQAEIDRIMKEQKFWTKYTFK